MGFASYAEVQKIVDPWHMLFTPMNGAIRCQDRQKYRISRGMDSHWQEKRMAAHDEE